MKTIKVRRMPLDADSRSHTHWEVAPDDAIGHDLAIPDDINTEPGMRWNGESLNPTQDSFSNG